MPQQLTILIVDTDQQRRQLIEQALANVVGYELQDAPLDDPQALMATIEEQAPSLVVIGAGPDTEDAFAFADRLSHDKPLIGLAIASSDDSAGVVMRAMRSGADELIKLPAEPDDAGAAVERILARKGQKGATGEGQIVTVFSGKGGCGSTVLATNIAINLGSELGIDSVVIVDLNLQLGDVGTFMDVRPRFTIADAAKEVERLDKELLKSFLSPHPSGAMVLACPNEPEEAEAITADHVASVLKMLKTMHRFVLVDTVHVLSDHSLAALDNSDIILLVTDMLVPSIRNAQRCLSVFKELGYPEDAVRIVVNRYYRGASVSLKDMRRALERPIWWLIPIDFGTVTSAIDGGLPLMNVSARSEVANSVKGLSDSLAGLEPQDARRQGLSKIFSSLLRK